MAIMETSTGSRSPSWGTIEAPGRPGSDVEVPGWGTCTKRYEHVDIWDQLAQPG